MSTKRSHPISPLVLCAVLVLIARPICRIAGAEEAPFGLTKRVEWTTGKITGSPEPPPPYRTEQVFKQLKFNHPLLMANCPAGDRLFVGEQEGTIYSFPNRPDVERADVFINLRSEIKSVGKAAGAVDVAEVYGLAFHPRFTQNRYCYICYTLRGAKPGELLKDGTRVSRFTVSDTDPPRCQAESEQIILTFVSGGHNGGCLAFGPDGYLYITSGDAASPNPPDPLHTGQDISDLLSSVLRVDVDKPSGELPYTIPADNPFVDLPGARGEVWAYGFRNPWKISFDRGTGDLWLGDVGWEMWEMLHRVERGGNYAWNVMEGPQPIYPDDPVGPTPLRLPTIELPHTEAASITGGFVYRGKKLPELVGSYIYGDWETRHIWGSAVNGEHIGPRRELVAVGPRVVSFGEDNAGELYVVGYDEGGIFQLVPNDQRDSNRRFPRKLSETGLLASAARHELAPGVVPFAINAAQWADHATAERMIALPAETSVVIHPEPVEIVGSMFRESLMFPVDGVLAKTISLEMKAGDPKSRRRLETQVLHFDGRAWHGYTYQWNDEQTDADLVDAKGADRTFSVVDPAAPGGQRKQTWHFASRTECMVCHNPWAGYRLAFNIAQLNREQNYNGAVDNQLRALAHVGIVRPAPAKFNPNRSPEERRAARHADVASAVERWTAMPKLSDPYVNDNDLHARARSYLHVNCSHCHQMGAGGSVDIELRRDVEIERTKCLAIRPTQGAFGITDAQILAPGDPYRSVLFYRINKLGRGRMPHIGSECVDARGLNLIHDWIAQLPVKQGDEPSTERQDQLAALSTLRSMDDAVGDAAATRARCEEATRRLLSQPSGALLLAHAMRCQPLAADIQRIVLKCVAECADVAVQEALEQFVPSAERAERLGSAFNSSALLALSGDAERGRKVFFELANLQCKNCHQIQAQGTAVGPELTHVGKKLTRPQILENIVDPSKTIESQFISYLLQTSGGQVYTGLLVSKTADELVLKDAQGKLIRTPAKEVEKLTPQRKSLMPDQLLRDLAPQQAADLLEYLSTLK